MVTLLNVLHPIRSVTVTAYDPAGRDEIVAPVLPFDQLKVLGGLSEEEMAVIVPFETDGQLGLVALI